MIRLGIIESNKAANPPIPAIKVSLVKLGMKWSCTKRPLLRRRGFVW
jgi:hypothetical protein